MGSEKAAKAIKGLLLKKSNLECFDCGIKVRRIHSLFRGRSKDINGECAITWCTRGTDSIGVHHPV